MDPHGRDDVVAGELLELCAGQPLTNRDRERPLPVGVDFEVQDAVAAGFGHLAEGSFALDREYPRASSPLPRIDAASVNRSFCTPG